MAVRVEENGIAVSEADPLAAVLSSVQTGSDTEMWHIRRRLSALVHDHRIIVRSVDPLQIEARILVKPGQERLLKVVHV